MFKTTSFLAVSLLLLGCSSTEARREASNESAKSTPEPTAAPSALQTAHDAYLAGDYVAAGEAIRDVLVDPSSGSLAKENALELLDSAYEATNGKLPTRFHLPNGITGMQLGGYRGVSKFSTYRGMYLWLRVRDGLGAQVDELSVLNADGTPIFTKGAPNTKVQIKHELAGFEDVAINFDKMDALPADGVYTIRVGMNGARVIDTWVIARHLEASAAPVITSPGEQIAEDKPIVKFEPFHSPEYTPYERRSLNVWVENSTTHVQQFNFWTATPDAQTEVRVNKSLPAGSYWLTLTGQERRAFGPIEIERSAQMGAPFNVVR